MNGTRRLALMICLLLAAAGGFIEHQYHGAQQRELAEQHAALARLEATLHQQRQYLEKTNGECADVEREIAASRQTQALAEAGSSLKLWGNRITLLKRLLDEMPGQSIPECRLLAPVDWVQVVRTNELDSSENIRAAFAALRAVARKNFAGRLQEALRRLTADSGGELPADIHQLAPYLSAPADGAMLERYAFTRSGRLGAADETLIKEKPVADMILSVGLNNWNINSNAEWKSPGGEDESEALARNMTALGVALDADREAMSELATTLSTGVWEKRFASLGEKMETALGQDFGDSLKLAVKRYSAERGGENPANFAQLLPYLQQLDKLVEVARPILAEFEYMRDHRGQAPTDPAQLRRYLDKPFDPAEVLQAVKITVEGDNVTATFGMSWGKP